MSELETLVEGPLAVLVGSFGAELKGAIGGADGGRDVARKKLWSLGLKAPEGPYEPGEPAEDVALRSVQEAAEALAAAVENARHVTRQKVRALEAHRDEMVILSRPKDRARGPFEALPGFRVPEEFGARVAKVLDWGETIRAVNFKTFLPTQTVEPRTGRPLAGYIEHLMYNVYWFAHFDSVVALGRVWRELLKQFPAWAVKYNLLESSLIHDSLAKSLFILGSHEGQHQDIDAGLSALRTYWAIFEADRLKDERNAQYKKPGPGVHGKGLFHPSISDLNAFEFRFLMWGKQEDRDAADYLTECLWDALDFVTAPDGKEIAIPSHGVGKRYVSQMGEARYPAAHFTVYTSDSMSDLEIAALMKFKFATPRIVAGLSRTLYWCYPTQGGMASDKFARDMGGGGLWNGKKDRHAVQFRDGSSVRGKWEITTSGNVTGDYAHQRGLTFISAYRNRELPNYKQELIDLDKRAKLGRHGIQQALLAWELSEAEGRLAPRVGA